MRSLLLLFHNPTIVSLVFVLTIHFRSIISVDGSEGRYRYLNYYRSRDVLYNLASSSSNKQKNAASSSLSSLARDIPSTDRDIGLLRKVVKLTSSSSSHNHTLRNAVSGYSRSGPIPQGLSSESVRSRRPGRTINRSQQKTESNLFSGNPYLFDDDVNDQYPISSSGDDDNENNNSNNNNNNDTENPDNDPSFRDHRNWDPNGLYEEDENDNYLDVDDEGDVNSNQGDDIRISNKLDYLRRQTITPVVYRFFARSQAAKAVAASITAASTGGSIPFILLVPNVDHWKVTGQELASRGYNVLAVGPRQVEDDDDEEEEGDEENESTSSRDIRRRYLQGPALVLQLMDALRWTKVVLVGCDSESLLAIQAAVALASSPRSKIIDTNDRRVVGLILCGKLQETENVIKIPNNKSPSTSERPASYYYNLQLSPAPLSSSTSTTEGSLGFSIDRFLEEHVKCPFTIVWDGDGNNNAIPAATIINARKIMIEDWDDRDPYHQMRYRSLLIGGGSAPHRRRPEYFAWVLSRFVEEQIAPAVDLHMKRENNRQRNNVPGRRYGCMDDDHDDYNDRRKRLFPLPWKWPEIISNAESYVVFGRVAATALFYAMTIKVVIYQYENLRFGIDKVKLFRQTTIGTIQRILLQAGSILLFRPLASSSTFEDDRDGTTSLRADSETVIGEDNGLDDTENATKDKKQGTSPVDKMKSFLFSFKNLIPFLKGKNRATIENDYNDHDTNVNEDSDAIEEPELQNEEIPDDGSSDDEKKRFRPIYWLDHVIT